MTTRRRPPKRSYASCRSCGADHHSTGPVRPALRVFGWMCQRSAGEVVVVSILGMSLVVFLLEQYGKMMEPEVA